MLKNQDNREFRKINQEICFCGCPNSYSEGIESKGGCHELR